MFESAEIPHVISKQRYKQEVPGLREGLLDAQYELLERREFSVAVLVGGVDGGGKGDTVNLLAEWLDPRHMRTTGTGRPTDEERERPPMWRWWRKLPPKGRIGVFLGSWYTDPILQRAYGEIDDAGLALALDRIRNFEVMLAEEDVLLVKLWFHLSKAQQKRRLKKLERSKRTRWRVTKTDWRHFELYGDFVRISSLALRETSTHLAPWQVVAGAEPRYRNLTVGRSLQSAIRARLERPVEAGAGDRVVDVIPSVDGKNVLGTLDPHKKLAKRAYATKLEEQQGRLSGLVRDARFRKRAAVAVFEGWDAAGKGGVIRRITQALDARSYHVVPIAAPTDEERARPYLWRFWRNVPKRGRLVLFDRSWYGRVLVERVEGFAKTADWMRAYAEINDFEEQLVDHGVVVAKLWLHIDADEQLRRFREREETGFKRFKITADDWHNREQWDDYERAIADMVDRTSTEIAPWTLVEANDKRFARVKVLTTLCDAIEASLT